jgi:hypothetical protein
VHASSSPSPKFMTLIPSGERPVVSILRRVHPYGEARFPRPSAAEVTGKATVTSNGECGQIPLCTRGNVNTNWLFWTALFRFTGWIIQHPRTLWFYWFWFQ